MGPHYRDQRHRSGWGGVERGRGGIVFMMSMAGNPLTQCWYHFLKRRILQFITFGSINVRSANFHLKPSLLFMRTTQPVKQLYNVFCGAGGAFQKQLHYGNSIGFSNFEVILKWGTKKIRQPLMVLLNFLSASWVSNFLKCNKKNTWVLI